MLSSLSIILKVENYVEARLHSYDLHMNMLRTNLMQGATVDTKTVAIIGASADRGKFSNKSVRAHAQKGWAVFPVNPKGGEIEGLNVYASVRDIGEPLKRVTLYVPPQAGIKMLADIAAVEPEELYLNPGTESAELLDEAKRLGLNVVQGCSIIDVGLSPAMLSDE